MNPKPNQLKSLKSKLNGIVESPDQLADEIAGILGCPITIEDSNHHVISYSKHKENVDEARIATIMNRKVPGKVINGLWKKGYMPRLIDSDEPVIIPEIKEIGLGNRVAVSIRKKNEILGFIWAQTSGKTLREEDIELLKEACAHVKGYFLKNRKRKRKSEEHYHDFFWKLLAGELQDTNEIARLAKQFNMKLEGNLAIVIIRFKSNVTEQVEKHAYYLSETQVKVEVVTRLFDENEFILLIRPKEDKKPEILIKEFIEQLIEKIGNQLKLENIQGSSGSVYDKPDCMTDSYKQAVKVLELQAKFPEVLVGTFLYEDLGVYQFIEELSEIRKSSYYKNKYIERLRLYDGKHRGSLLPTLQIYLQCDCNVYRAAKVMFIHPNTMNYRLKRIKEVTNLDLKDPNQKTAIYLDLIMESIIKA